MVASAFVAPLSASSSVGEIAGAVMIDVVGAEHFAGELLQPVILFVGGVVRADDAELAARGSALRLNFSATVDQRLATRRPAEARRSTCISGDCRRSG